MDILDFLFKLVARFSIIDKDDYDDLYGKMKKWRTETLNSENPNWAAKLYVKYGREWYVQLAIALLWIPAVRYVHYYINPELDDDDKN